MSRQEIQAGRKWRAQDLPPGARKPEGRVLTRNHSARSGSVADALTSREPHLYRPGFGRRGLAAVDAGSRNRFEKVTHIGSPFADAVRNVNASTEQRSSSLTPLQALYFLNAPFPARCASSLAALLLKENQPEKEVVQRAFAIVYGRAATAAELDQSAVFLKKVADAYQTHHAEGGSPRQMALVDFLKAMFASNEFMFIE
jgi:hypothetical protein